MNENRSLTVDFFQRRFAARFAVQREFTGISEVPAIRRRLGDRRCRRIHGLKIDATRHRIFAEMKIGVTQPLILPFRFMDLIKCAIRPYKNAIKINAKDKAKKLDIFYGYLF